MKKVLIYISIVILAYVLGLQDAGAIMEKLGLSRAEVLERSLVLGKKTPNARWLAFIDFTAPAFKHRFYLIDLKNKSINYSWFTSHGSGSGGKDGLYLKFSNRNGSHMSSRGIYKTAETYYSAKFKAISLRLDGTEKQKNIGVRNRAIVLHPAGYVSRAYMKKNNYPGRSWGCITLDPEVSLSIINKLKNGSILFVYGG